MDQEEVESDRSVHLVPVYFYGKRYDVPDSFTIMQAYEFTGHQYIRGCGCKGGACGACASIFMTPEDPSMKTGLACQTQVVSGMTVIQIPYFPTKKQDYELEELEADAGSIAKVFPELYRCMGCNTCTKMCPQDIDVMECMSAALRGDIERIAVQSLSCVMCGLCAARCPAEIAPYNIMLLGRRLYGKYIQEPYRNLPFRLKEIDDGKFDAKLDELMRADMEVLKDAYTKQQADKRII